MDQNQVRLAVSGALLSLPLMYGPAVMAATPMELGHQNISVLQSFISPSMTGMPKLEEFRRNVDFKNTLHVRVQETYMGYPVMGADAVVHIPNGANTAKALTNVAMAAKNGGSMDGTLYQNLGADLASAPSFVFSQAQAQKAIDQGVSTYQTKIAAKPAIKDQKSQLLVYVDKNNTAHWAFKVSFLAAPVKEDQAPAKPVYIMDAVSLQVYAQWDDIKTLEADDMTTTDLTASKVYGGGYGGNKKMGKLVYDGLKKDLAKLSIERNTKSHLCYLQNADVVVERESDSKVMSFKCKAKDSHHNRVYWDGSWDAVNDGYSPGNDALFAGQVIKHMYQDWYNVPVLTNSDGSPMLLTMVVHYPHYDNAFWDGQKMTFGDGQYYFYPLTSLGVGAHEISHGFTEQHSDLYYYGQSGGMNEAYSDMAAQAAEFYAYGKNSWEIGPEIFKQEGRALRYMYQPSKDCDGGTPGDSCSIDDASQYNSSLDVHYSSGVYNHFFYFLGTTEGWDPKKAFDVMVQANTNYWTTSTDFASGACGVLKAGQDLGYNLQEIKDAFTKVKIKTDKC